MNKLMNLDVYFKKLKGLHISTMKVIRQHPMNYIDVDMDKFAYDSDEDELDNAMDDCEHPECHELTCKFAKLEKPRENVFSNDSHSMDVRSQTKALDDFAKRMLSSESKPQAKNGKEPDKGVDSIS